MEGLIGWVSDLRHLISSKYEGLGIVAKRPLLEAKNITS